MSGRCLCGAVSFVVTGPLRDVLNCHCHRCRRFTGHHMAATNGHVDDVEIADPEALLRWYEGAGGRLRLLRAVRVVVVLARGGHARPDLDQRGHLGPADGPADRRGLVDERGERLPRPPAPAGARDRVTGHLRLRPARTVRSAYGVGAGAGLSSVVILVKVTRAPSSPEVLSSDSACW